MPNLTSRLRIVLVALCVSLFIPGTALAQDRVSLQISPTMIEEPIDPGTDHEYTITVKNLGDVDTTLYPVARNIIGLTPDGQPQFDADQTYELASWLVYKESSITVPKGGSQQLHFTVKFPKDAHPGSHMAGLYLADKSSTEIRNGSSIGFEVGAILSFSVAGDIIEDTQIREFYASKSVYGEPKVGFTIRLENEGNILTKPVGFIDITNMFNKKVASILVNQSEARVFPKTTREFSANWNSESLEFGRYEAVVALVIRGINGDQTISRVVQFWILPMNVLTPVLGGFLVLILLVYILLRLYIRKQLAGAGMRGSGRNSAIQQRNTRGLSRLAVVVIALLIAIILGLFILFFYFG